LTVTVAVAWQQQRLPTTDKPHNRQSLGKRHDQRDCYDPATTCRRGHCAGRRQVGRSARFSFVRRWLYSTVPAVAADQPCRRYGWIEEHFWQNPSVWWIAGNRFNPKKQLMQ
jgi:hypothetical protein